MADTCIADTNSVDLTIALGVLHADVRIDPATGLPLNLAAVGTNGLYVQGSDGWMTLPATLGFTSASSPTYVCSSTVDLTSFISPGTKLKLVQGGVTKYFVVVAITAAALTLYGGDTQVLAAGAITLPKFSYAEAPSLWPRLRCSSTLPTVGYDGQRIVAVIDAVNGIDWTFEYRSASASASKWEFVGGPELIAEVLTSETTSPATYGDLATIGPSVSIPYAGDYMVTVEATIQPHAGGTTPARMAYSGSGVVAADADAASLRNDNAGVVWASIARTRRKTGLTAGTLVAKYASDGAAAAAFFNRSIRVSPVRST